MKVLFLLTVAAVAVVSAKGSPNSAALINRHALLDKESAELAKAIAGMTGDIAAMKNDLPRFAAEVEGQWKPEAAEKAKKNFAAYYTNRRELWIANRNREFAQKMISRLVDRVPKVRDSLKKFYEDYNRAEVLMNSYVEAKESSWHNARMSQLSSRLANELREEAKALETKGAPASVVSTKRASAADEDARAVSYTKMGQEASATAVLLRGRVVNECVLQAREECNVLLRDFTVGQSRLWTAYRNKALATDEIARLEPETEANRVGVVEDTFRDRNLGVAAFRLLRNKWVEIWKLERTRSITMQRVERIKARMDRIWAELNDQSIEIQKQAADPNGPVSPRDIAEVIAGTPVTYQTSVGKQAPIANTRPVTQFAGPNTDPEALVATKEKLLKKNN